MQAENKNTIMNKKKGWVVLLSVLFMVYIFGVFIGPWFQQHIFGMEEIVTVMEESGIDGGAYYYTEIEGAADGYAYLDQSLRFLAPEQYGLTLPFLSGIITCLLILYFGFRFLPR